MKKIKKKTKNTAKTRSKQKSRPRIRRAAADRSGIEEKERSIDDILEEDRQGEKGHSGEQDEKYAGDHEEVVKEKEPEDSWDIEKHRGGWGEGQGEESGY